MEGAYHSCGEGSQGGHFNVFLHLIPRSGSHFPALDAQTHPWELKSSPGGSNLPWWLKSIPGNSNGCHRSEALWLQGTTASLNVRVHCGQALNHRVTLAKSYRNESRRKLMLFSALVPLFLTEPICRFSSSRSNHEPTDSQLGRWCYACNDSPI